MKTGTDFYCDHCQHTTPTSRTIDSMGFVHTCDHCGSEWSFVAVRYDDGEQIDDRQIPLFEDKNDEPRTPKSDYYSTTG